MALFILSKAAALSNPNWSDRSGSSATSGSCWCTTRAAGATAAEGESDFVILEVVGGESAGGGSIFVLSVVFRGLATTTCWGRSLSAAPRSSEEDFTKDFKLELMSFNTSIILSSLAFMSESTLSNAAAASIAST